jgi:hypothetical protein
MSKQFINEVSRMKDLFGYKKGQVISEQVTAKQTEAMNAGWGPVTDETAKSLKVGSDGKILPKSTNTLNTDLEQMDKDYLSKPITGKPDANHGKQMSYKEPNGTTSISIWDGYIHNYMPKAIWEKKFGKVKPKPVVQIPKELKSVKDFQDWMDINHPNWVKGKNLNKGGGYGKFGPSTSAAWRKYKNEYLGGSKANTGGLGVPSTDGGETITPTDDSENPYLMYSDRG